MENNMEVPQKTTNRATYASAIPFLSIYLKECTLGDNNKDIHPRLL
jgi:hypothetical protein